jgi:hypothetical protein
MRSKVSFIRYIFPIIIIGIFTGCARHKLPTAKERSYILKGKKTIVLLRVTPELEDGTSVEPFRSTLGLDNIYIGLGSFLVGGKVKGVATRFLSPETRKQSWTYLILEPGIHYIVFLGPLINNAFSWDKKLGYDVRFRVDIPKNKSLVYIGTLHLYCKSRSKWQSYGFTFCKYSVRNQVVIRNEESLARKLATEYLSDFGPPQTLLMQFFH